MLEREIEKQCCAIAKFRGWIPVKVAYTFSGFPDRMFLGPGGKVWFVEFKAPGRKPTPLQARMIERLRGLGHSIDVIDNVDDFGQRCEI